jgi:membrane protein
VVIVAWLGFDGWLTWLAHHSTHFGEWPALSFVVTTAMLSLTFGASYHALPARQTDWRDVWPGGIVAGTGIAVSKFLLSAYFAYASLGNVYGPAGAVVVILLWFYYTSMVYFFGAQVVHVYAHICGSRSGRISTKRGATEVG